MLRTHQVNGDDEHIDNNGLLC